ncbi:helix-turn-helix domain-containing protein [Gorillibacterium timonense]|uniref:helix-turn-helix domain-containing protein n=1 Tax=Gorillibacterium timonense TaxID=1689269 RepID=UPI00071E649C|nr:helix-turn-helix domain-containing protein [Gorillibacterium timonense]
MKEKLHIQAAIKAIELSLADDFKIDQIARLSHVSPMQLYRDFYQLTGHSVKEYIRKRRLSNALSLVKHSDRSFADIAYEYGYSSQQSFCRSVKAATGLSPMKYKESDSHYYFPMFNSEHKRQIQLATETIPETLRLTFMHSQLRGFETRAVAALLSLLPGYDGRLFGRNGSQQHRRFCYELYIPCDESIRSRLTGSVFTDIAVVPEATACFAKTCANYREDDINAAWDYLYTDWLKTSMFKQADMPYFEEYLLRSGEIKKLVLFMPVSKRDDYPPIRLSHCEERRFLVARKTGRNAEENASKAVLDYLLARYPTLLKSTDRFYVAKKGSEYTCGVQLNEELPLPPDSGLELLRIGRGNYAILDGDCCGESRVYESTLQAWIEDNGLTRGHTPTFSVYETCGNYSQDSIRTKIYIRLNNGING